MTSSFWIMIGIVVFVMAGQALLWSWVFLERRRKIPDVKIFNIRELFDGARKQIDDFYNRRQAR